MGETASHARSAFNNPAEAKTVTVVEGQEGDAGAVFDLASRFRLGVGPVSSKRWGDGGRKTGEETTLHSNPVGPWFQFCPESAENCHGRDVMAFPGSGNFSQSPAKVGVV